MASLFHPQYSDGYEKRKIAKQIVVDAVIDNKSE